MAKFGAHHYHKGGKWKHGHNSPHPHHGSGSLGRKKMGGHSPDPASSRGEVLFANHGKQHQKNHGGPGISKATPYAQTSRKG